MKYLLVGSGPEKENLIKLAEELAMNNCVIFTGWLPYESDVVDALRTADIGLVMRIGQFSDNFHVTDTLSHEMACGLPILAARLKGFEGLIEENETGLLFDPADMEEFKTTLLQMYRQQDERIAMGKRAREKSIRAFDIELISSFQTEALLRLI